MPERPKERFHSLGQFGLGALLALAVVIAALLSASPALHERLHSGTPAAHLCAVTLFASGQCESISAAPVFVPPEPLPLHTPRLDLPVPLLATAHFFARLEHAPPAFA